MAKFKLKLKLQGLELEVEGSRDGVPLLVGNLGQQMTGLLQPMANIAQGDLPEEAVAISSTPLLTANGAGTPKRCSNRNRRSVTSTTLPSVVYGGCSVIGS